MARDPGKDLGYHWRRSAGVYDAPDHEGPPGNAHTTTDGGGGLVGAPQAEPVPAEEAEEEAVNEPEVDDLDGLTKAELLDRARALGAFPANAAMSKDELRAAVEGAS